MSQIFDFQGNRKMPRAEFEERSWSEDFSHENGNYNCVCGVCGQNFVGHKRRVTCKTCAAVFGGWIVGNADGTLWRTWRDGWSIWTPDRDKATRYHRREDAEAVHQEDDDAWRVVMYAQ